MHWSITYASFPLHIISRGNLYFYGLCNFVIHQGSIILWQFFIIRLHFGIFCVFDQNSFGVCDASLNQLTTCAVYFCVCVLCVYLVIKCYRYSFVLFVSSHYTSSPSILIIFHGSRFMVSEQFFTIFVRYRSV